MNETETETVAVGGDKIIRLDEAQLRDHLDRQITQSVEETLNQLLTIITAARLIAIATSTDVHQPTAASDADRVLLQHILDGTINPRIINSAFLSLLYSLY